MNTTLKTLLIASVFTLPMAAYAGHHDDNHEEVKKHEQHEHKAGEEHKDERDAKQCMEGEDCPMHEGMKHTDNDMNMSDMKDNLGEHKH